MAYTAWYSDAAVSRTGRRYVFLTASGDEVTATEITRRADHRPADADAVCVGPVVGYRSTVCADPACAAPAAANPSVDPTPAVAEGVPGQAATTIHESILMDDPTPVVYDAAAVPDADASADSLYAALFAADATDDPAAAELDEALAAACAAQAANAPHVADPPHSDDIDALLSSIAEADAGGGLAELYGDELATDAPCAPDAADAADTSVEDADGPLGASPPPAAAGSSVASAATTAGAPECGDASTPAAESAEDGFTLIEGSPDPVDDSVDSLLAALGFEE